MHIYCTMLRKNPCSTPQFANIFPIFASPDVTFAASFCPPFFHCIDCVRFFRQPNVFKIHLHITSRIIPSHVSLASYLTRGDSATFSVSDILRSDWRDEAPDRISIECCDVRRASRVTIVQQHDSPSSGVSTHDRRVSG